MRSSILSEKYASVLQGYGLDLHPSELTLLHFERGEYLYKSGSPMTHLMLVVQGQAKVCRNSSNGKTLLLTFYSGSGILGEIELLLGLDHATTDVQAITPFTAIGLPYALAPKLLTNANFVLAVARKLAYHMERITQNSVANLLNPLQARLCSYIAIVSNGETFHENLTVLAELLGVSYRHLLRTLEELCSQSILKRAIGGGFIILDAQKLQALGGDMYRI